MYTQGDIYNTQCSLLCNSEKLEANVHQYGEYIELLYKS